MNQSTLNKILEDHKKWLNNEPGGVKAVLRGTDLQNLDLRHSDLRAADFRYANLEKANFQYANLSNTNFRSANLYGTNFRGANLQNAILQNAILRYAKAQHADLWGANLQHTDLLNTNFQYADLSDTNLRYAYLEKANLRNTHLCWVDWDEATGVSVYVAGLQSSRKNAQLTYIPSIDIVNTGCFQGSWQALKERIAIVYKTDNPTIYHKYQLAIAYIEAQIEADNDSE